MVEQAWWWGLAIAAPVYWVAVVVVLRFFQMRAWRRSLIALELRLPRDVTVEQVSRWVGSLRAILRARRWWSLLPRLPVGIEITATAAGVVRVLVVPRRLRGDVQASLSAVLPGARIDELGDYFTDDHPARFQVAVEAKLTGSADVLASGRGEDTSRHLLAALQPLQPGERVRVQWLMAAARSPRVLLRAGVSTREIKAEVAAPWLQREPVLWASCRVAVASRFGKRRARVLYGRIWGALRSMNTPGAQLVRRALPSWWVARRVRGWAVPVRRWPILATSSEIAGLLGLVAGPNALPGVPDGASRTLPPPLSMPKTGLVVAASNYPGSQAQLCLSASDRLRHLWMIGPTGVGKSNLLCNMVNYDINHGDGLVVIDARGDLVADVLDRIPGSRADDVIVIDPTSGDHVVGINPLQAGPPEQPAGFVFHVLHSIYASSWGPRTADLMRASLLTLTTTTAPNGQPFTLVDVPELLTNARFRRLVTTQPLSSQLAAFWRWYDSLSEPHRLNIIAPALNKLRTSTLSSSLRQLLGQSRGVQFVDVLGQKKIVLVALKKGLLGAETSGLVGSLVMASVWQSTLSRANLPACKRRPAWLYIDEFQDVVRLPLDLSDMLAQARGLGLGLILAHQYLSQLTPELKAAVIGTARSQLVFQLGDVDAKKLATGFAPLSAEDLQNLGAYEIALRPCVGGVTLGPVTGTTYPMPEPITDGEALAEASRRRYGMPAAEIDDQISARITVPAARGGRANRIITGGQP